MGVRMETVIHTHYISIGRFHQKSSGQPLSTRTATISAATATTTAVAAAATTTTATTTTAAAASIHRHGAVVNRVHVLARLWGSSSRLLR